VDDVLDRLEAVIARLADPNAPLERLVGDFEEAGRLAAMAGEELKTAATTLGVRTPPPDGV
jgi:exonuclease VII small subunit